LCALLEARPLINLAKKTSLAVALLKKKAARNRAAMIPLRMIHQLFLARSLFFFARCRI
jgi:hypothetical protein